MSKEISLNGGGEQRMNFSRINISTIDSLKNIIEQFELSKTHYYS